MKNQLNFFLLSIELSKNLVGCDDEGFEVVPIFSESDTKAVFNASFPLCQPIDLILKDDFRLSDIEILELKNTCPNQEWRLTSENIFKRCTELTNLTIQGPIKLLKNVEAKEILASQLFHVPSIRCFHFQDCPPYVPEEHVAWVMPPNLENLIIEHCDYQYVDFNKTAKLKYMKIIHENVSTLPNLTFPTVQKMDITNAKNISFKIPDIAFFCNMTKFLFDFERIAWYDECECLLLKTWQEYLVTQNITLTIGTEYKPFNKTTCVSAEQCPNSTASHSLMEANSSRIKCLTLKLPEGTDIFIFDEEEFNRPKQSFWIFVVGSFLIITVIFGIVVLAIETFLKPYPEPPVEQEVEEEE